MSDAARIGDYEVLDTLGSGGMGRVYKVRNVITDRVEAMKVLLPDLQGHEGVAARFQREIKVLAALQHPNIATLHTALTIDNQLVMIMEFVEGQSLSSRLDSGPIPATDALNYLEQVLGALSYAHQHHVIHRDIKPANMMLTPQGTIKLMDFGIARTEDESSKLTAPGSTLGSMSYMSPEQIKGETTDERSDLYSLGISLYELVTGEKPFHGDSNFSIMAAHINQPPRPPVELHPGLPKMVNDLILTSIAKAPEQRFQTAEAFRNAVKQTLRSMLEERTVMQGSQDREERTVVQGSQDTTRSNAFVASAAATTTPVPVSIASRIDTALRQPQANATMPVTPPPPQAQSSGNRGLYMVLGVLVFVVVLAAAGLYLPMHKNAAASDANDVSKAPAAVVPAPSPVQPAATLVVEKPAEEQPLAKPPEVAKATPAPALARKVAGGGAQGGTVANATAPAANTAELDAVEHDIDQLTSRAAAVNNGLDNLRRQQEASGLGLRGDIAGRQASMKVNLAKAQNAIQHNDLERAKRYSELTSADVDALEKFLGR